MNRFFCNMHQKEIPAIFFLHFPMSVRILGQYNERMIPDDLCKQVLALFLQPVNNYTCFF